MTIITPRQTIKMNSPGEQISCYKLGVGDIIELPAAEWHIIQADAKGQQRVDMDFPLARFIAAIRNPELLKDDPLWFLLGQTWGTEPIGPIPEGGRLTDMLGTDKLRMRLVEGAALTSERGVSFMHELKNIKLLGEFVDGEANPIPVPVGSRFIIDRIKAPGTVLRLHTSQASFHNTP